MSDPTAKVFTTGGSQAVRLPKAYRLEEGEVIVRRLGKGVVLTPRGQGGPRLWERIDAIGPLEPMPYPDQPVYKERDWDAIWDERK